MKKATLIYFFLTLLSVGAQAAVVGQRFFNLSGEELKIDSMLPQFAYSFKLPKNFQDSVYSVRLTYPEFEEVTGEEFLKCRSLARSMNYSDDNLPIISTETCLNQGAGSLLVCFTPISYQDGVYKKLTGFKLELSSAAKSRKAGARANAGIAPKDRYAHKSVLAEGRWAKIRVSESGIYQLTDAVIKKAGFTNLSKVKIYGYGGNLQNEKFEETDLIEFDDLKELPSYEAGGKRLFYGKGPVSYTTKPDYTGVNARVRNPYSNYGYYFITQNDDEPLMLDSAEFVSTFYPSEVDYHVLHEIDNFSWYQGGRNLCENSPIEAGNKKEWTLIFPKQDSNITDNTKHQTSLRVVTTASTATKLEIEMNGKKLTTQSIDIGEYYQANSNTFTTKLTEIPDTVTIGIRTLSGGPVRLDYIDIAKNAPKALPKLSTGNFPEAEYVYNITNQNHHADSLYDMVIIIPTTQKFVTQAKRLKDFHEERDGLTVKIVPADELYNEFSSGTPDANAYRRYLKMMYDRADGDRARMPKYLLLFGDCAYDNRMLTPNWSKTNPDDYLLCFESENSFSETDCYVDDGFFCLMDDGEGTNPLQRDLLDVAVGRIPATTVAEAKTVVDKTISYANNENAGAWQNHVVFMGDDGNKNIHMRDACAAADSLLILNPNMQITKVMWDAYEMVKSSTGNSYPEVSKQVKALQNAGALIMNYSGHGRADQMSHETVLNLTDFANFTNKNLPLWITASCDIMPFDQRINTIGETALFNQKGGAVAFFGTTRTVYTNRNKAINLAFLTALFTQENGEYITLGEAQRKAKNQLIEKGIDLSANKLQYSLLGDPALRLNIPRHKVVIDSINGTKVNGTDAIVQLKATSRATISGHVERAGAEDKDFNGTVTLNVKDAEKTIVCRLNNTNEKDGADTPHIYNDRIATIFCGSDSVRNGRFSLTFAVPKDIQYDEGTGLINAFAVNSRHETANGVCESFVANSTEDFTTDSIGPSIYCYLNSPEFQNGGDVNPTPLFYAEVTDKDGINATGSGIGHDLQLVIDGKMVQTYSLNENFTYDFGSYTSGHTFFYIPELTEGKHSLRFRAWDILNNSSSTTLTFNVRKDLEPQILNIYCTKNPARDHTAFVITHDRRNTNVTIEIEVMDMTGKPVWRHTETGGPQTSDSQMIDWNLNMNNGGKLQTGIYLYRVRLSCDGTSRASKAKKLIVINN